MAQVLELKKSNPITTDSRITIDGAKELNDIAKKLSDSVKIASDYYRKYGKPMPYQK